MAQIYSVLIGSQESYNFESRTRTSRKNPKLTAALLSTGEIPSLSGMIMVHNY